MRKITLLLLFLSCISQFGQSKKVFDIELKDHLQEGLYKHGPEREGKTLEGENLEYSILNGGYFTFGTSSSYSENSLDQNSQLTYGHPYALTSYVKIFNDGRWYNPAEDFESLDYTFSYLSDTLTLNLISPSNFNVAIKFVENVAGKSGNLSVSVENFSTEAEEFKIGIVLDPALGKRGDGNLMLNDELIQTSSVIEPVSAINELKIYERKSSPFGMGHKLNFLENTVSQIKVANWREFDLWNTNETQKKIFDLALEILSEVKVLGANELLDFEIELELLPSDYSDLFVRADLPTEFSIEQNMLFPQNIDVSFELFNSSASPFNDIKLNVSVPYIEQNRESNENISIEGNGISYTRLSLPIFDIYEDVVVPIEVQCLNNNQLMDSFERNLFIPAVPISDTGLVVSTDSLIQNYPQMGLKFNVKNEETGAFIFNLQNHHIFLYQNDERVDEFELMKDTSNGVTDIDVAFVLDVTGSMSNEIEEVKTNIVEFANSLEENGYDYNLALVTFLDEVENVYDFTSDVLEFKSWVSAQHAHGGGDYPENSLDALMEATTLSFRKSSNRVIIWITDASYQINNDITQLLPGDVISSLLASGITTHCIGNPGEQVSFYEPITVPTGGDYYDINGNFRDILIDIARLQYLTDYLVLFNTDLELNQINSLLLKVHYAGLGGSNEYILGSTQTIIDNYSASCYPNPFNPVTTISINKAVNANGVIEIFNILGQKVKSIPMPKGSNHFKYQWNGRSDDMQKLSSGIYLMNSRITENGKLVNNNTIKLMLLK